MNKPGRRELLATYTLGLLSPAPALAKVVKGSLPWTPGAADPPAPVEPDPWRYFTAEEATTVEALADRLIPPDPEAPGGKDIGCVVFIDRQLADPTATRNTFTCQDRSTTAPSCRATSRG